MSLLSSSLPLRRPVHGVVQAKTVDPQLFTATTLLLAVLIGDALLILTTAPRLADLASLYLSTT